MATLEEFLTKAGDAPILVSACLLGLSTRYDGSSSPNDSLRTFAASHRLIPICPEQLGGLPTPRAKSVLSGGDGAAVLTGVARVLSESGRDLTEYFLRGAKQSSLIARLAGARFAVLKEKSPSCGVSKVYVDRSLADGMGVTTAVLRSLGIEVFVLP